MEISITNNILAVKDFRDKIIKYLLLVIVILLIIITVLYSKIESQGATIEILKYNQQDMFVFSELKQ
jgi:hypothetical protein